MASFRTEAVRGLKPLVLPDRGAVEQVAIDINWPDAAPGIALNDVIQVAELPPGVEVVDFSLITGDIDSNGAPTVAFAFGELNAARTALAVTYQANLVAARTGGVDQCTTSAHLASNRQTTRMLGLVATTAAATSALAGQRAVLVLHLRA